MGLRIIYKYCRRIFPRKSKRNKFNIKTFDFFLKIIYIINADFISKAELAFAPPRLPRRVKCRGKYAGMAELADASDSGSDFRKEVQVQVLLPAPNKNNTNPDEKSEFVLFFIRDYFEIKF